MRLFVVTLALLLAPLARDPVARAAGAGPARIASGSLASDEVLLELLGRQGALARLVAVSTLADDARYSNIAGKTPKAVAGRVGGELESLLALKPDLVILASFNKPETLTRLESAHVPVLKLTEFRSLEDIEKNIETIGLAVHAEAEAKALLAEFRAERAKVREAAHRRDSTPALLDYAADRTVSGADTLFDALAREAGAVNLSAKAGLKNWPRLGVEPLSMMDPDYVIVAGDPEKKAEYLSEIRSAPGWKGMMAVREGRIIVIPAPELAATSHYVIQALKKLAGGFVAP